MAEQPEQKQKVGVYTKTIVPSPVIRWILHARIRHRHFNDIIFVGDDFISVKQIGAGGSLQHVATKTDFDSRIRAATSFQNEDEPSDEDFLVKLERSRSSPSPTDTPPSSIVLTLESNDLVFVFIRTDDHGTPRFVQQACPMPSFGRIMFQPGEHLAVDPFSRALAVAANEREIILYSTKPKEQIQHEIETHSERWCPVASQHPLQVEGVIQHMDFLIPPSDDEDHVILLLIVLHQGKIKAVRIDWYSSNGPFQAQVHPAQALEFDKIVPNLLIPLRNASFLLIAGNEHTRWANILTGSASSEVLASPQQGPKYAGNSSRLPVWASWAKPRRNKKSRRNEDTVYLVREDGAVFLISYNVRGHVEISAAGDLACHVGTAFASLGDEDDPDILAVAGEMGSGKVVSIGTWANPRRFEELSREDTMNFELIEMLPNWASITDMISTGAQASRTPSRVFDNVLVTSGRQPYGTVTELRRGIEARQSARMGIEGLRTVNDVWALPGASLGSIIFVLSSPSTTRLFVVSADFDSFEEVGDTCAFDTTGRTLSAGFTASGHLIQVTARGICASTSMHANFEDTTSKLLGDAETVLAATVVPEASVIVTAERHGETYCATCYDIQTPRGDPAIERGSVKALQSEPLCLAAIAVPLGILLLTATNNGMINLILLKDDSNENLSYEKPLPSTIDQSAACDHVAILQVSSSKDDPPSLLAVCGLRDGKLVTFKIDFSSKEPLSDEHVSEFGHSTVKLVALPNDRTSVCVMSGSCTCLLSWDGISSGSFTIDSIWITDILRPDFGQEAIVACAQTPSAMYLSSPALADSLVLCSGEEFLIASLDRKPTTVPRQIPVSGSPNRVLYGSRLRCIVCASLRTGVRLLPSSRPHAPPEWQRQIWPTLDFIPTKNSLKTYTYDLQPGERINAMIEWNFQRTEDKLYYFILVGGSYLRPNGTLRGRVAFLQPIVRHGEVVDVTESQDNDFDHEVYALAMYDKQTYIACAANKVFVYRLVVETKLKWEQICLPFELATPGQYITVSMDRHGESIIAISSAGDSLITLKLAASSPAGNSTSAKFALVPSTMGQRAEFGLSHHVFPPEDLEQLTENDQFTLMTTKTRQLIGMESPDSGISDPRQGYPPPPRPLEIVFEAILPRCLTRLTRTNPPIRKRRPPPGVIQSPSFQQITGSATDGALVGIAMLEGHLWRRLFWLQRLIEWSEELSPHLFSSLVYRSSMANGLRHRPRALPAGLSPDAQDMVVLYTSNIKDNDMHIDGDMLARVLGRGGVDSVKRVLHRLADTDDDATGVWVREHLDQELAALDQIVDIVRQLDRWM